MTSDPFMLAAIEEARSGEEEGGVPIGSVLVRDGNIVSRGRNVRVQKGNPFLHAELECLQNAIQLGGYQDTILYTTMMPCYMCGGAVVKFGVPKVIAGESTIFPENGRAFMESHGVEVVCYEDQQCIAMVRQSMEKYPKRWA